MTTTLANLEKLNRLRVNANMSELKSWKASSAKLQEKIQELIDAGHSDALPGANLKAAPSVTPELQEELKKEEETAKTVLGESALAKSIDNSTPEEPKKEKPRAKLARGLDTDSYARQSREKIRDQAEADKREAKAKRKAEKAAQKVQEGGKKKKKKDKKKKQHVIDDAKIVGKVDEKADPEKAARQKKHIEDKQKARAAKKDKPKEVDPDNFTVADLARELDIDPKTARNKLRRHVDKIDKLHSKGQDKWTFPNSAKKEIAKILRGDK